MLLGKSRLFNFFGAISVFFFIALGSGILRGRLVERVEFLQGEVNNVVQEDVSLGQPGKVVLNVVSLGVDQWSSRSDVDEMVQQASQEASRKGIVVRSLAVTHQAASSSSDKVVLDISTNGSYAALKAWQSSLMENYPSLAVHNLRLKVVPVISSGLEAQWTWVLYVRD